MKCLHFSVRVGLLDGYFGISFFIPSLWVYGIDDVHVPSSFSHLVLNYIGPSNGQGLRIYFDGTFSAQAKQAASHSSGDGRVVVGRFHTEDDEIFDIDELLFFNHQLSDQEIMELQNMN